MFNNCHLDTFALIHLFYNDYCIQKYKGKRAILSLKNIKAPDLKKQGCLIVF